MSPQEIEIELRKELEKEIGDFFEFLVESTDQLGEIVQAVRFRVTARLDSRIFERFHIDISYHDSLNDDFVRLTPPDYLSFAEVKPRPVLCYSVAQHLAEKIHAIIVTRQNVSSRVKDMVDILIFAGLESHLNCEHLRTVIRKVFQERSTQIPDSFNHIPENWRAKYGNFANQTNLPFTNFDEAAQRVNDFLNPVMNGEGQGKWNSEQWQWVADIDLDEVLGRN